MWWAFIRNSFLIFLFMCGACKKAEQHRPAILYLASSLGPLVPYIQKAAKNSTLHIKVLSSSAIAQEVALGAPCDGLVLADRVWQSYLYDRKLIDPTAKIVATNALVLATTVEESNNFITGPSWQQLLARHSDRKLILADPEYVPLGRYSKMALKRAGMTKRIENAVIAHSAQMALVLLKQKAASLAILYQSDVDNKEIVALAPLKDSLTEKIAYPYVLCTQAKEEHRRLLDGILLSAEFREHLKRSHFGVLPHD